MGVSELAADEATEGWRQLHTEERHNLCTLKTIIQMQKNRRQ
jgi:hypothetical protein